MNSVLISGLESVISRRSRSHSCGNVVLTVYGQCEGGDLICIPAEVYEVSLGSLSVDNLLEIKTLQRNMTTGNIYMTCNRHLYLGLYLKLFHV